MLVSWVRVLEGRFRDPLVGRDLLLGCAVGALASLVACLTSWVPEVLGGPAALPTYSLWTLESLRGTIPSVVGILAVHTQMLLQIIFR